jgi:hypothetical protein
MVHICKPKIIIWVYFEKGKKMLVYFMTIWNSYLIYAFYVHLVILGLIGIFSPVLGILATLGKSIFNRGRSSKVKVKSVPKIGFGKSAENSNVTNSIFVRTQIGRSMLRKKVFRLQKEKFAAIQLIGNVVECQLRANWKIKRRRNWKQVFHKKPLAPPQNRSNAEKTVGTAQRHKIGRTRKKRLTPHSAIKIGRTRKKPLAPHNATKSVERGKNRWHRKAQQKTVERGKKSVRSHFFPTVLKRGFGYL